MICTAVDHKAKSGTSLKRLRNVGENPQVTTLADEYSDNWDTLWVGSGRRAGGDPDRGAADGGAVAAAGERYRQYRKAPPTGPVLAVTVERWSGWAAAPSALPGSRG